MVGFESFIQERINRNNCIKFETIILSICFVLGVMWLFIMFSLSQTSVYPIDDTLAIYDYNRSIHNFSVNENTSHEEKNEN